MCVDVPHNNANEGRWHFYRALTGTRSPAAINAMKKALPDPSRPSEVLLFYYLQLKRWALVWLRDSGRDIFGTRRRKRFSDLLAFKGSGRGRECFVFANGPSVKKLDPDKVAAYSKQHDADIFCVNHYVSSEHAARTMVDFWVLSDPKILEVANETAEKARQDARRTIRKGIFVPEGTSDEVRGLLSGPCISFNDTETSCIFSKSIDPTYPRSYLSMSAYKALALAVYGGYKTIYVCGFDNTYIRNLGCDKENRIYRKDEHFDATAYPRDHQKRLLKHRKVSDELISNSRLFSDLFRFSRCNVINLDVESLTDAFRKEDHHDFYL